MNKYRVGIYKRYVIIFYKTYRLLVVVNVKMKIPLTQVTFDFQGAASALLASMEKEKELLRIFLKVSQMENTILRRMNLSSFLMVSLFLHFSILKGFRWYNTISRCLKLC